MNALAEYWAEANLSQYPYVHPKDASFFKDYRAQDLNHPRLDAITFPTDRQANDPHFFHLSLLPVPYIGDLDRADIFILMLNPGFSNKEYEIEALPGVEDALRSTLSQELASTNYPFWYLNPKYREHPGHDYWLKHLKGVDDHEGIGDYQEISRRLAVIQMMPYHSAKFNANTLTQALQSSKVARDYVQQVIVPRARAADALLIVARQVRNWGFRPEDASENLVVYSRGESIGAQVSAGSRGGRAVREWLSR